MNDLLSKIGMCLGANSGAYNLEKFFKGVVKINRLLNEIDELHTSLKAAHDECKKADNAGALKALQSNMDHDMGETLRKAKLVKDHIAALDKTNEASLSLPDCGPGSATDCTRSSAIEVLAKKLNKKMEEFQKLQDKINEEYIEVYLEKVLHIDRGKS